MYSTRHFAEVTMTLHGCNGVPMRTINHWQKESQIYLVFEKTGLFGVLFAPCHQTKGKVAKPLSLKLISTTCWRGVETSHQNIILGILTWTSEKFIDIKREYHMDHGETLNTEINATQTSPGAAQKTTTGLKFPLHLTVQSGELFTVDFTWLPAKHSISSEYNAAVRDAA